MNKRILLSIFGVIVLGMSVILFVPFGNRDYKSEDNDITLKVPRLSTFKDECCMTVANFTSIRSEFSLKVDIQNYLKSLEEISCNENAYYYDKEQDFTITKYYIENNLLYRNFGFEFGKGRYCDDYNFKYTIESNDDLRNAKGNGIVVYTHDSAHNTDKINDFYTNSSKDIRGYVTLIFYTVEGDPVVYQYHYSDGKYVLYIDNTRDKFSSDDSRKITEETIQGVKVIKDSNGNDVLEKM